MKTILRREFVTVYLPLSAAVLVGAYLRLRNIAESPLWLDELFSVAVSQPEHSFSYVFQKTMSDVHPPLFQMVLWLFYKVFGFSEMMGRYLSVAFGIMLIPAVFVLGRQTFNLRVGLYSAWLVAINYFLIRYSNETRSYELLAVLTTVAFVAFIRAARTLDIFDMSIYALVAALLVNTHYFGFLVVLAQAMLVLIDMLELPWDKKRLYRFGFAGVFILFSIVPLIHYIDSNLRREVFWIKSPSDDFFIESFSGYFGYLPLTILAAGLLMIAVSICLVTEKEVKYRILFSVWVGVGVVIPYLYSIYVQPVLTVRNTIFLLPAVLVFLGVAIEAFKNRWNRLVLGGVIFSLSMTPIFKGDQSTQVQMRPDKLCDIFEGLSSGPLQWPVYSDQYLQYGMCLKFIKSPQVVNETEQLARDLSSEKRPEYFYYLFVYDDPSLSEEFMKRHKVVFVEEKKMGPSTAHKFHSLRGDTMKSPTSL